MSDNQESQESSLLPSPPSSSSPGDNSSVVPRRKRWAPKVKTGCVTCRVRRVKCDEGKPQCVRCTAYGYVCDGYVTPTPAGAPKTVTARVQELDYNHRGPLNLETRYRPGFLLAMTAQHISLLGIATDTLPHPTHLTSISQLWAKFHAYMVHNIQDINNYLQGHSPYNRVLALLRITDVTSVELSLLGTTWRAHNSGFLALLKMDDAVGRELPPSPGLEGAKQFQVM
ncbi:hypothetical protein NQ176_g8739 [Zarea fungicola]|uniref:Uncharacterized protein n=1 Tax=Zarea fungicola TaxID=93591 RepID=A0ACC1MR52_9HYPO|nr:hypothetical protein NQ176_g8739 [Lecanicillium fungicola]